jgi:hypothetical protein
MNQQQRAVVQQALEAFKGLYAIVEIAQEDIDCRFAWAEMPDAKEAIAALRQLLEQPEPVQEPVAWVKQILDAFPLFDDDGLDEEEHHCEWALQQDRKRLHAMLTTPPAQPAAWVGLTEEDLYAVRVPMSPEEIARAIEAKLKEKNT